MYSFRLFLISSVIRGKTREFFRKIRDIKGTSCPKMGTIKDRNNGDLVDTGEIKKAWKEYTEELFIKDLNEQYYHNGLGWPFMA